MWTLMMGKGLVQESHRKRRAYHRLQSRAEVSQLWIKAVWINKREKWLVFVIYILIQVFFRKFWEIFGIFFTPENTAELGLRKYFIFNSVPGGRFSKLAFTRGLCLCGSADGLIKLCLEIHTQSAQLSGLGCYR